MKLSYLLSSISVALYASSVSALNPLIIKGNKFFDQVTGDQFYIKGVAYQPGRQTGPNKDPLSDIVTCKRDIAYFKDLGLNTIRVYEVDNTLNHDACMNALADAGIYLVLDISTPADSINRLDPVYDLKLLDHYKKTIDAFANYSNVLGFFAGNEVVNQVNATSAAPFVKASIRDLKQYMKTKPRQIPIGYSTSDDATIRVDCADYFNCGSEDERIDFYGYNLYSWCGNEATFQSSQYAARTKQFATYSAPVFLSEFGCNTNGIRTFHQVKAIFGPDMEDTFSGGIVYEYTQEANDYGLVVIGPDGGVTERPCYHNLKQELASVHPTILKEADYTPSPQRVPSQCPAEGATWMASTNIPPTPSQDLCDSMVDTLKCVYVKKSGYSPDMSKLFNWLCGEASCTEIAANGKTGTYGKYAGCNADQRLSYMFNEYYIKNGENAKDCDFQGMAAIVTPSKNDINYNKASETTTTSKSTDTEKTTTPVKTTEAHKVTSTEATTTSKSTETKSTNTDKSHSASTTDKSTKNKSTATVAGKPTESKKDSTKPKSSEAGKTTGTPNVHKSGEAPKATETEKLSPNDTSIHDKSTSTHKVTGTEKSTATETTVVNKSTDAHKVVETKKTVETHKIIGTDKSVETHKTTETTKSESTHKSTEVHKTTETKKTQATDPTTEVHQTTLSKTHKATETNQLVKSCVPSTVSITKTVTVPASRPTETTCVDGTYECVDSGRSAKFTVCSNGRIFSNVCAPGTVCQSFEGSILCDWA